MRASDAGVELVAGARTLKLPAGDVPQAGQAIWQNDKGSAFGISPSLAALPRNTASRAPTSTGVPPWALIFTMRW